MSDLGEIQPSGGRQNKPPKRNWEARRKDRFFDLKFSHYVEIILTCALVGIAYFQYTIYDRQAGIMRDQADIASAQNELTKSIQRAFVIATDSIPQPVYDERTKTDVIAWQFSPAFENDGPTGTESLSIVAVDPYSNGPIRAEEFFKAAREETAAVQGGKSLPSLLKSPAYYLQRDFEIGSPVDPAWIYGLSTSIYLIASATLGPKQKILVPLSGTSAYRITPRNASDAQGNNFGRFFYGMAKYIDVFHQEHVTKYCFRIDGISIGASSPVQIPPMLCKHWNCADKQCDEDRRQYDAEVVAFEGGWKNWRTDANPSVQAPAK